MVGTVAAGELKGSAGVPPASVQGAGGDVCATLRFAVATHADDAAIRRLLRENPLHGAISVSFEREPDYFRSAGVTGAKDDAILAFEADRLICLGRCTTRDSWLGGAVRRVGYLGELRLDATAQGRFDVLRGGYRFFHELHRAAPADFYFTSIASDNVRARRLLERGVRGLPRYEFLTEFETLVIPARAGARFEALPSQVAELAEVVEFLNETGRTAHLATAWTAESLGGLVTHGLSHDHIRAFRVGEKIVACGAVWDQRSFRQTVIRGYAPALRWTRSLVNACASLFGRPRLPAVNSVVAHAFATPLAIADEHVDLTPQVVATLCRATTANGLDYLTLGFAASDPRLAIVRKKFPTRRYVTRLYRVSWPGESSAPLDVRLFRPELALL